MNEREIIQYINNYVKNTLIDYLGIEFTKAGDNFIEATMPVEQKTYNPARILHGGAMMALAETVGSALSYLNINMETHDVRGLEINGNHLKSVSSGFVTARGQIIHKGRQTHVSEIKITDQQGNLLNISRMTNIIVEKQA
ncbi:MAG: hypothetical protein A2W97_12185 [Bacteroidetes bacterium GWE2_40_63]|nr:MAG: hypothetical protein A2W95_08315 [Bacteroidetes bacterium GWA2_40_14]OFX63761.1 MAG: hypothetical protein A2W84_16990 [Bacteroidetes bacterium GWC2_40_13]OFX75203.1 MAG: hypothetical protein A2W96_16525 [Bacteroidetes bacterium GWD2_40_43]OFX89800.1 MAG: hypothetical protein A2W97_12185 [Bacteroidetes bacterium GWE2_40_63]OFY22007.1 MAG: hypothetical protein A2W88_00660 [Bacteroidetes bacterium GWF2_40_13]OFZ26098.1 MAG: hypothetical protein A2437_10510 [Bacteroidetes bacterium RIFOXYC